MLDHFIAEMSCGPAAQLGSTRNADRMADARHVADSTSADALTAIVAPDVNLAIWRRASPFGTAAVTLADFDSVRRLVEADDVQRQLRDTLPVDFPQRETILADIGDLVRRFATIMACERVVIRLERITGNACWKFHGDYVTVRLLCTYLGKGTQWLADGDPNQMHQLPVGAVGLFKGRELSPDHPIIHRSPPIGGIGETRLLLVIDPASGDDAIA